MNNDQIELHLKRSLQHYKAGDYNVSMQLLSEILRFHPDNQRALYGLSLALRALENHGLAMLPARRCVELNPESSAAWNTLGMSFSAVGDIETAAECFKRSLALEETAIATNNLGDYYMTKYEPEKAIDCFVRARAMPDAESIMVTLNENEGYCRLALRQWKRGWELYELGVGRTRHRRDNTYGDAVLWDGKPTGSLVVWGEQGLGDEIMFASCVPDVKRYAKSVHIDTVKRLKGLFARSFPWATVHGTRADEVRPWTLDEKFDARCILGSLPKFFRNTDGDFPGKPYLLADPERRAMCRTLLDRIRPVNPRRPKIGIAWTGGTPQTGLSWRSLGIDDVARIVNAIPEADWISLEYKRPEDNLPFVAHHYPYLVQSGDYDDTAALVAELDYVVSVQTAVVHLAGGLGVPAHVLVSDRPVWRYGSEGSRMYWYESVTLHRQPQGGDWTAPIAALIETLKKGISSGAYHGRIPRHAA